MQIEFINVEAKEAGAYLLTYPLVTDPPWAPFANFFKEFENRPGYEKVLCPGYCAPHMAAENAVIWAWIRWHLDQNVQIIRDNLAHTVRRGLRLHQTQVWQDREKFDLYIMLASILSGDRALMVAAAESVWDSCEQVRSRRIYPLYPSFTGILKHRVLGDAAEERQQAEVFSSTGGLPWVDLGGKALLRRFLERDYKSFNKQLPKDCERYTTYVQRERTSMWAAVVQRTEDRIVVDLTKRIGDRFWPFVQAALSKLAIIDGATITHDSVWHPLQFVRWLC